MPATEEPESAAAGSSPASMASSRGACETPLALTAAASGSSEPITAAGSESKPSLLFAGLQTCVWESGTWCVLLAALIFSVSATLVKLTGHRIPVLEITLVRSSASWVVGVALCWRAGIQPMFGHRDRMGWLVARGLTGASAMILYYCSITLLPIADAVTLFFMNPSLTVALAWAVRGERLGWLGVWGCASSFVGLLLLVHPPFLFGGHEDWGRPRQLGAAAGVVSAFCCAGAFLCIRMIGRAEPALVVALWFHSGSLVMSSLPLLAGWPERAVMPSAVDWALLLGVASTSFLGQLLMTRGFQLMPASKASSCNFTQVIYSYGFGMLLFHEHLSAMGLVGTCLIAAGVVAVNTKPPADRTDQPDAKSLLARDFAATNPWGSQIMRLGSLLRPPLGPYLPLRSAAPHEACAGGWGVAGAEGPSASEPSEAPLVRGPAALQLAQPAVQWQQQQQEQEQEQQRDDQAHHRLVRHQQQDERQQDQAPSQQQLQQRHSGAGAAHVPSDAVGPTRRVSGAA